MSARIYLRVSTEEQAEEGYSLQAQERACRLYCELHGVLVAGIYTDEGYSGTTDKRPAFHQLASDLVDGDLVIVHKLDRFARNTHLLLQVLQDFERRHIRLVSVTEQIDFSSPIGKVMLTLLAAFGQYYVDNLRTETAKGLREKAQRGLWVGPVPFGYQKQDKHLVPSDDAPIVQMIYLLFVAGYSYRDLVEHLNTQGYQAYDWQTRQRHIFHRETVRTILRNRAYLGYVSCGGVEYPGLHQPLISVETWAAAEQRRAERSAPASGKAGPSKPLAGLLYCARCEHKLWFHAGGRSGASRSYACPGRRRGCVAPQSRADLVEHQIADLMRLIGLELEQTVLALVKIWVDDGEVVALTPTERYRQLFALLGWQVRE